MIKKIFNKLFKSKAHKKNRLINKIINIIRKETY